MLNWHAFRDTDKPKVEKVGNDQDEAEPLENKI
jgi:hypothetical protein